jgi:uroporphyrin-3 C-methyltransferase
MNSEYPASKHSSAIKASPWRWSVALPILLAVAALVGSALLWEKLSRIQSQLARQSADAGQQSLEAKAWAKQAQETVKDSAARIGLLESRVGEVALQRGQLDELMQSLSRSRDENLVVDIEAALRMAQQQSQLTGSMEPMLAALKSAQQRVQRVGQPRLTTVQRAIEKDLEQVKSAQVTDVPGLLIKLDQLVAWVDELPLANQTVTTTALQSSTVAVSTANPSWWQVGMARFWQEVRGLLRVSRIDAPEAALLSPDQSFFLRENLKLKLLNARMGLLARQSESLQADLTSCAALMGKYFDMNSRKSQQALQLIEQSQLQLRKGEMPRLDSTLTALAMAAAGR